MWSDLFLFSIFLGFQLCIKTLLKTGGCQVDARGATLSRWLVSLVTIATWCQPHSTRIRDRGTDLTMMWRGPGNGATRQFWPFGRPEVALGQRGATKVFLAIFLGSRKDKVRSTTVNVSLAFQLIFKHRKQPSWWLRRSLRVGYFLWQLLELSLEIKKCHHR